MITLFDDPFRIAAINARTRALSKFDLEDKPQLDPKRVREIYLDVARMYRPGDDMPTIIERALDLNEPFRDDHERGAYKIAYGIAGHECRKLRQAVEAARQRELQEQEWFRFAPEWAYEQDT